MRQTEVVLNCLMPKSTLHNTNLLFIDTNAAYGYNLRVQEIASLAVQGNKAIIALQRDIVMVSNGMWSCCSWLQWTELCMYLFC